MTMIYGFVLRFDPYILNVRFLSNMLITFLIILENDTVNTFSNVPPIKMTITMKFK